jgi:hypothetical protein
VPAGVGPSLGVVVEGFKNGGREEGGIGRRVGGGGGEEEAGEEGVEEGGRGACTPPWGFWREGHVPFLGVLGGMTLCPPLGVSGRKHGTEG